MRAVVAFIIPTTAAGIERRGRALRSLLAQSDPEWIAVAVGNDEAPYMPLETRYYSLRGPENGGQVRAANYALLHLHMASHTGDIDSEWVAFLDDHDTVSEALVARVRDVEDNADVIVFRTQTALNVVLPNPEYPALVPGEVGSAVVFRRAFLERRDIMLEPVADRLSYMLREAFTHGARVLLHPSISYFEKDYHP